MTICIAAVGGKLILSLLASALLVLISKAYVVIKRKETLIYLTSIFSYQLLSEFNVFLFVFTEWTSLIPNGFTVISTGLGVVTALGVQRLFWSKKRKNRADKEEDARVKSVELTNKETEINMLSEMVNSSQAQVLKLTKLLNESSDNDIESGNARFLMSQEINEMRAKISEMNLRSDKIKASCNSMCHE